MNSVDTLLLDIPLLGLATLMAKAMLLVAIATYLVLQYEMSPAATRHLLWVALLLVLAALPAWTWIAPQVSLPVLQFTELDQPTKRSIAANIMLAGYALVAITKITLLLYNVVKIAIITAAARPAPEEWCELVNASSPGRTIVVRKSHHIDSPVTWGYLRPVLLVPIEDTFSDIERRMVVLHEIQHIRRDDWLAQLLGQLVSALFWPVPGIRHALQKLSLESERACDDYVLSETRDSPTYAALLLRQAQKSHLPTTVALGQSSELGQRIRSMCGNPIDHSVSLPGQAWLYPLCLLMALPVASIQVTQQHRAEAGTVELMGVTLLKPSGLTKTGKASLDITRPLPPDTPLAQPEVPIPVEALVTAQLPNDIYDAPTVSIAADVAQLSPPVAVNVDLGIKPRYPRMALKRNQEGYVRVRFRLQNSGRLSDIRIISAEPQGVFEQSVLAALEAVHIDIQGEADSEIAKLDLESQFRFRLHDPPAH